MLPRAGGFAVVGVTPLPPAGALRTIRMGLGARLCDQLGRSAVDRATDDRAAPARRPVIMECAATFRTKTGALPPEAPKGLNRGPAGPREQTARH